MMDLSGEILSSVLLNYYKTTMPDYIDVGHGLVTFQWVQGSQYFNWLPYTIDMMARYHHERLGMHPLSPLGVMTVDGVFHPFKWCTWDWISEQLLSIPETYSRETAADWLAVSLMGRVTIR